jgi:hypothetical protein
MEGGYGWAIESRDTVGRISADSDRIEVPLKRHGRACPDKPLRTSMISFAIVDAMSVVAGMDACLGEQLHVIRYLAGGQYRPHL